MKKLHKKYIILNVFLIIYIISLSVGYAYFSESIKATGTAKTVNYYTNPVKIYLDTTEADYPPFGFYFDGDFVVTDTIKSTYAVTDYISVARGLSHDGQMGAYGTIFVEFIKDVEITNYTVTMVDNNRILKDSTSNGHTYYNSSSAGGKSYISYSTDVDLGSDTFESGSDTVYGLGDISFNFVFVDDIGYMTSARTITFNISYKSQGKTWNNTYKMIFSTEQ